MKKKNLYLVFGTANQGKSSLIRCLTGVFRSKTTRVKRIGDEILIKVFVSSAQERWIGIDDLIEKIENAPEEYFLISIRIDAIQNKYGDVFPKGQVYYDALVKKFKILGVVILGKEAMDIDDKSITRIDTPKKHPSNHDASIVRHFWNWV